MSIQDRSYMADNPQLPPPVVERIIEREKKPGLMSRLLVGMLSHLGVTVLLNSVYIWPLIPVVGAALLWLLFGWKATPPTTIIDKAAALKASVEEVAEPIPALPMPEAGPKSIITGGLVRLAAVAEGKAKAALGLTPEQQERERKRVIDRADKLGLTVDPAMDTKELRRQVEVEEARLRLDADHQARLRAWRRAVEHWEWERLHGVNAFCPDPKCHHPMRLGANREGGFVCAKCNGHYPCSRARALFTPPPRPREPQPSPPRKRPTRSRVGVSFRLNRSSKRCDMSDDLLNSVYGKPEAPEAPQKSPHPPASWPCSVGGSASGFSAR